MLNKITVINYLGESLELPLRSPEKSGLVVKEVSGLGPVKGDINTTKYSSRDGVHFNSARMNSRNIVLDFLMYYWGNETIEEIRAKTYKYFPVKKMVKLLFETDTVTAYAVGYVESNEPTIFSSKESTRVSIVCPDPFFRALDSQETEFNGVASVFEFPFSCEVGESMDLGIIINYTEHNVYYTGDDDTGVTISIHALGDIKDLVIYNTRSRESMAIDSEKLEKLTGKGIVKADDIIICTVKGQKSVTLLRDGVAINILNTLTKGSKWLSITKGDNLFAYTASYGQTNIQFKILNEILFEGI